MVHLVQLSNNNNAFRKYKKYNHQKKKYFHLVLVVSLTFDICHWLDSRIARHSPLILKYTFTTLAGVYVFYHKRSHVDSIERVNCIHFSPLFSFFFTFVFPSDTPNTSRVVQWIENQTLNSHMLFPATPMLHTDMQVKFYYAYSLDHFYLFSWLVQADTTHTTTWHGCRVSS